MLLYARNADPHRARERLPQTVICALTVAVLAVLGSSAYAAAQPTAPASVLAPPAGEVYTGVSSGPADAFGSEGGKHPAVYGEFVTWGQSIHFAFNDAAAAHARLMLHISTSQGLGARQVITPQEIGRAHVCQS